jgi:hypothetical protein
MHNQHASAGLSRICAWCGTSLNAPAAGRAWGHDDLPTSSCTHTICDGCLATFFDEEFGADELGNGLQPVGVRRRG